MPDPRRMQPSPHGKRVGLQRLPSLRRGMIHLRKPALPRRPRPETCIPPRKPVLGRRASRNPPRQRLRPSASPWLMTCPPRPRKSLRPRTVIRARVSRKRPRRSEWGDGCGGTDRHDAANGKGPGIAPEALSHVPAHGRGDVLLLNPNSTPLPTAASPKCGSTRRDRYRSLRTDRACRPGNPRSSPSSNHRTRPDARTGASSCPASARARPRH